MNKKFKLDLCNFISSGSYYLKTFDIIIVGDFLEMYFENSRIFQGSLMEN